MSSLDFCSMSIAYDRVLFLANALYFALKVMAFYDNSPGDRGVAYSFIAVAIVLHHLTAIGSVFAWRWRWMIRWSYQMVCRIELVISGVLMAVMILTESPWVGLIVFAVAGLVKPETCGTLNLTYQTDGMAEVHVKAGIDTLEQAILLGEIFSFQFIPYIWTHTTFSKVVMVILDGLPLILFAVAMCNREQFPANDDCGPLDTTRLSPDLASMPNPSEQDEIDLDDVNSSPTVHYHSALSVVMALCWSCFVAAFSMAALNSYAVIFVLFQTSYSPITVSLISLAFTAACFGVLYIAPRKIGYRHLPSSMKVAGLWMLVLAIVSWIVGVVGKQQPTLMYAVVHWLATLCVVYMMPTPLYSINEVQRLANWQSLCTSDLVLIARYIGRGSGVLLAWWSMFRLSMAPYAWIFALFMFSASQIKQAVEAFSVSLLT